MRKKRGAEYSDGPFFLAAGPWGLRLGDIAARLGGVSWRLFVPQGNYRKEVFNIEWHLKQRGDDVMAWPISVRRDTWKRILDQYELERKE